METLATTPHHGQNIKRIRELLGVKQEALGVSLGLSQQSVSQLEQKELIDDPALLGKVAKALGVSEEAIKNFNEKAAINIISNTYHDTSSSVMYFPNFNPIEKLMEVVDENRRLYERLIQAEKEKNELLQQLLKKQR